MKTCRTAFLRLPRNVSTFPTVINCLLASQYRSHGQVSVLEWSAVDAKSLNREILDAKSDWWIIYKLFHSFINQINSLASSGASYTKHFGCILQNGADFLQQLFWQNFMFCALDVLGNQNHKISRLAPICPVQFRRYSAKIKIMILQICKIILQYQPSIKPFFYCVTTWRDVQTIMTTRDRNSMKQMLEAFTEILSTLF